MADEEAMANTTTERSSTTPPNDPAHWESRRRHEKERKARILAADKARRDKENLVLAIAASGASLQEIANQVGLSKTQVHTIYRSAMDRIGSENVVEYRQSALHSLGVLHQTAVRKALVDGKDQARFMREARQIRDQMNKLEGAYPPAQIDVAGEIRLTREISIREATGILARIQAQRIVDGEAALPAIPALNAAYNAGAAYNANGHAANGDG